MNNSGQESVLQGRQRVLLRELFDLLESYSWDHLVKVKPKNLEDLLKARDWTDVEDAKEVAKCGFRYLAKSWQRSISLKNSQNRGIIPREHRHEKYSSRGFKPNWPQLSSLCSSKLTKYFLKSTIR